MASGRIELIAHGAEAKLYRVSFIGLDAVAKVRIPKPYRHPLFDRMFRVRRTSTEARVMSKLFLLGLRVPAVYYVDPARSLIIMEYIEGCRLSDCLPGYSDDRIKGYAYDIGRQVAVMHSNAIYHGDLTIANVIIKDGEPYIIDFGLSGYSRDVEEYAIDIHLLSRSLEALYPDKHGLFMESFWRGYSSIVGSERAGEVEDKVRDIRLRGRYVEERLRRRISRERYV